MPSATEKPFPAQHVCSHNKGQHGATALQKISHAHPIESMSVYVFPLRSLRPCRQLVHPPRARTRASIRARTPARASDGFSFSSSHFTYIPQCISQIWVNIIASNHDETQQQISINHYYSADYERTYYFTHSKSRNHKQYISVHQLIIYRHLNKNSLISFTFTLFIKSSVTDQFTLLSTILP